MARRVMQPTARPVADMHVVVVGAGIFGLSAALEFERRGYRVTVVEAGEVPNPLAASTDISKVVRMEYGADADYMALGEESREGWLRWNDEWARDGEDPLYHDTGVVMMCMRRMEPGGFEHDSFELLKQRGHAPERLDADALKARFPAWRSGRYVDGFFHADGGYVESGAVLVRLADRLRKSDRVRIVEEAPVAGLAGDNTRVSGALLVSGETIEADHVVIAAGAWTAKLYPELQGALKSTGHPVFHLKPTRPELFEASRFPTFTADVARTGYYGFPLNRDGVVKIGVHGVGVSIDPDEPRRVTPSAKTRLVQFLNISFPDLLSADIVYTRLCLYADAPGEDFVIDGPPGRSGVTVASGGSGHGFKFGPVLGGLIADAVEGKPPRFGQKFSWARFAGTAATGTEAARCHEAIDLR